MNFMDLISLLIITFGEGRYNIIFLAKKLQMNDACQLSLFRSQCYYG